MGKRAKVTARWARIVVQAECLHEAFHRVVRDHPTLVGMTDAEIRTAFAGAAGALFQFSLDALPERCGDEAAKVFGEIYVPATPLPRKRKPARKSKRG